MSKLSTIIAAFLGDAESAVSIVGDALSAAVTLMAQHGTRQPVDDAIALIEKLSGRTLRERAIKAGLSAVSVNIKMIKVGKTTAADAETMGNDTACAFTLAAVETLTAIKAPGKKATASETAARALKALKGLSDVQILAMLKTPDGADLLTRVNCLMVASSGIVGKTAASVETAKTTAKTAIAQAMETAALV